MRGFRIGFECAGEYNGAQQEDDAEYVAMAR
jgi:hypothetical protein